MVILPHIRDMGGVGQKSASGFLMAEVKKPRTVLVGVGLKVKKKIDLVGGRYWPFFELIKDIECGQHSISVRGDLKGGYSEVISHPLKK